MGNSPAVLQLPQVMRVKPAYLQGENIYALKLASQNFPIIEKCKMKPTKYALGHLVYTGTGTKDLWLLVKYVLCFLSCLFPLISGSPLAMAIKKKAV